jgi:uracil-DNA glycosylase
MSKSDLPFADYQYPSKPPQDGLIILVGEAPGAEEARQGKPFVGRSGQLLNKNLAAAGIDREACLVANVFRVQPPQNKVAHFFLSARKAKETGEAIAEEWGKFASGYVRGVFSPDIKHLQKTLKEKKPAVIVTLGRTPLWALTGMDGILSLRGKALDCRLAPGIPVIPTYHPSYIMRGNWSEEKTFAADLAAAKAIAAKRK